MSLSDLIQAEKKNPGTKCTFQQYILRTLNPEDIKALNDALDDQDVAGSQIHRALVKAGFALGKDTVRRHRSGECSCGPR